jgi:endoglucanase
MEASSLAFLKRLLDSPGPSGFETVPARVWRQEAEGFAMGVRADVGGNSYAAVNPEGAPKIMFAGHIDEIGLMVMHIDDDGFLFFSPIGGWDHQVLVGQRVRILTKKGDVPGVIGKRAIHLIKQEDRKKVSKPADLWIDIGAKSKDEALELVRVGDPAVLDTSALEIRNGRLASRSIDNRIGAFVVLEALRLLSQDPPAAGVHAVATSREEIAWTGGGARTAATGLQPLAAIVVDVTHATDFPGVEKKEVGDVGLGGGPVLSRGSAVNPVVFEMLAETAEDQNIPYQTQAAPGDTGTDADAIHSSHHGIATGLVSVPNRYMHSPNETVELDDLTAAASVLAGFARRVNHDTNFVPG